MNRVRARSIFAAIAVICAGCSPAGEPTGERAAAPLSGDQDTSDWLEYADSQRGISFRYPPDFGTQFIRALDWPPMLELLAGPFECTEAGEETARADSRIAQSHYSVLLDPLKLSFDELQSRRTSVFFQPLHAPSARNRQYPSSDATAKRARAGRARTRARPALGDRLRLKGSYLGSDFAGRASRQRDPQIPNEKGTTPVRTAA